MFGKKKTTDPEEVATPSEEQLPKGYTPAKGVPTPKRKYAEARRQHPIVADRSKMTREERKALKAEQRARSDEEWRKAQEAMKTGDERHMPPQHAGPVRRFARDYLDARTSLAEGFMPLAIVLLFSMFVQTASATLFVYLVLAIYAFLILMGIDAWWAWRNTKLLIEHKFGPGKVPPRSTWQMVSRIFYIRRWRMPRPMVKRGQWPEGGTPEDLKQARIEHREARKAERAAKKA